MNLVEGPSPPSAEEDRPPSFSMNEAVRRALGVIAEEDDDVRAAARLSVRPEEIADLRRRAGQQER